MLIDIIVFILLLLAAYKGFRNGLILALFSFLAFIIGLAAAIKLSAVAAGYIGRAVNVSQRWLPVLAFAVVYEGRPGETVSGGKVAAPIVNEVFTKYFEGAPTDDPLVAAMNDVPQALPVDEGEMEGIAAREAAQPAEAEPPPPPPEQKTLGGFFRRLFKRSP